MNRNASHRVNPSPQRRASLRSYASLISNGAPVIGGISTFFRKNRVVSIRQA